MSLSWHGGPHGLPSLPLAAGLVALAALSLYTTWPVIRSVFEGYYPYDWEIFREAATRLEDGTLYDQGPFYAYRWSPVAAWILGFVTLMPIWLWQLLHVAALPVLGVWWLVVACLVSYPFWFDVQTANLMTFVAVLGVLALRGSRWATWAFLALTLLIPRPLMFPLAAWVLWRRPETRLPFVLLFVIHALLVLASGYADEWLATLLSPASEIANDFNFGPSALIGSWWIPIGAALAVWLTWRGRLGFASLAASPYWLPYYFLMLLLEAVLPAKERRLIDRHAPRSAATTGTGTRLLRR